jgi:hypothetical protein
MFATTGGSFKGPHGAEDWGRTTEYGWLCPGVVHPVVRGTVPL